MSEPWEAVTAGEIVRWLREREREAIVAGDENVVRLIVRDLLLIMSYARAGPRPQPLEPGPGEGLTEEEMKA